MTVKTNCLDDYSWTDGVWVKVRGGQMMRCTKCGASLSKEDYLSIRRQNLLYQPVIRQALHLAAFLKTDDLTDEY